MKQEMRGFGTTPSGIEVREHILSGTGGLEVSLISYGATVRSIRMPDRTGTVDEITLGFDSLEGYLGEHPYFGSTVGRVANRIAGGTFTLDGKTYSLVRNDGQNHLHGGTIGFNRVVWRDEPFSEQDAVGVRFFYTSRDGEEGYPGTLEVSVTYRLSADGALTIEYEARTDRTTPVNLTNHTYWNLHGAGAGTVMNHTVRLSASRYVAVGPDLIPTGTIEPVAGTPLEFTVRKTIGKEFSRLENGYDHCFVVDRTGPGLVPAAEAYDPETGRGLRIATTEPGIQFYSSNMLTRTVGAGCRVFDRHGALCLEAGNFPDAVNNPAFPSPFLKPGTAYRQTTRHEFFTE